MEIAARLLFIALVTGYLLGRVFAGPTSPMETLVYAGMAAFGLEFVVASWRDLWSRS